MNIVKEIKKLMLEEDISQAELAARLDVTQQNVSSKFKRNDLRISEIASICNALGYEFKISFIKK
jgi:DNA-binding Xre family transcriptional regulator